MKIFLDSSNTVYIERWKHIIDGVTTNPSILMKEEGNLEKVCEVVGNLPLSVESGSPFYEEAVKLWDWLKPFAPNLVVKVPFLDPVRGDNLKIIDKLVRAGIKVNCTAVMSTAQVLLASKVDPTYISIFIGRIDDEGGDFSQVIKDSLDMVSMKNIELIAGSIRTVGNVIACIKAGIDIVTVPPPILEKMVEHHYSRFTSKQFQNDYVSVDTLRKEGVRV